MAVSLKIEEFFKYFFTTIKKGKFLLIKGIAIAILTSIISIISNLLGVYELTYLNAFLSLNYFATMLAFGVSQGTNIIVNQNISIKGRVEKSVKMGFELILILAGVITTILAIFPRFFMETITSFVPNNYTFYYIMCAYFFFSCLVGYLEDTLDQLKIFKLSFLSTSISYIFVIVGFLLLYFIGVFLLNYIAIVYVLSGVLLFVLYYVVLLKRSGFNINVFKFVPISFTKKQWTILISNFFVEVIWEVGYFATSIYLLRTSDMLFNTYSYLENVLDILNCFFASYRVICAIEITRALGKDNFNEAKLHAKNLLLGTLVLYIFYVIFSLLLIYPIALGVNDEYFSAMFYVLPCYVIIHLFRFFSWVLSSYMLRLGGKNNLIISICSASYTIWCVILCFISNYLPSNTYFVYFMIALPDIIFTVLYLILYKRGKWLNNIQNDPNLLSNKIKCFIFDFDDTLYYDVSWKNWNKERNEWVRNHFGNYSDKEFADLLQDIIGKKHIESGQDIIKLFIKTEGSSKSFNDWRYSVSGVMSEEKKKGKSVPKSEIKKFRKQCNRLNGKMFIVSNSTLLDIKTFMEYYKMDRTLFDGIFVNTYPAEDITKEHIYKEIVDKNKFKPDEVMVIGNSYKADILPAKKLKMHTFLCKDGFTYDEVVD